MSNAQVNHKLRRTLAVTEQELKAALDGVCDASEVQRAPTDELLHIEEMLTTASHLVRRAIKSRQKLDS